VRVTDSSLRSPAAERLYAPPDSRQSWRRDEFEEDPWFDDPGGDWPGDEQDRDLADEPRSSRWPNAVTLGIQAGVWWLRRRFGRFQLLAAVGIGIVTTLASYTAGLFSTGLAGSALSLVSLAALLHAGADVLPKF